MMRQINFTKMVASGNDFVVIDSKDCDSIRRLGLLARQICDRKYGIGADGLLIVEKANRARLKMRIFNPDGTEPDMCGNGIRCVSFWWKAKIKKAKIMSIETKAGIIESQVNKDKVKVRMTDPKNIKLDLPIKINKRTIRVNFINTGVPHTVIFAQGLDNIDVVNIGRQIRNHAHFLPMGTNVDFVQIIDDDNIKIRTYERGVEDETLACGTGTVAAALITSYRLMATGCRKLNVYTKSGEVLRVEFNKIDNKFKDVWLAGKARVVYRGVFCA
ncbi:MAG: diaminopimelate epimerase [Candidatus Omnitrophota bacterium]